MIYSLEVIKHLSSYVEKLDRNLTIQKYDSKHQFFSNFIAKINRKSLILPYDIDFML